MITVIRDYNLQDIKSSIQYLLDKASKSEEVRQLAIEITYQQDKISSIYDWVKGHVSYVPDPRSEGGEEIELFTSPVKMVKDYNEGKALGGDCDDMALLTTALYRAIGIKSSVVIIDSIGQGLDHAFCRVWSGELGSWVNSDPSSDYPLGWALSYKERIIVE